MRGIMFNEHFGLESAVLSGRKTQTRRIIKFNKDIIVDKIGWSALVKKGFYEVRGIHADGTYGSSVFRMPYQVGEVVAIKQSYETILDNISKNESIEKAYYFCKIVDSYDHKGDDLFVYSCEETIKGWHNKMFVKNDLMPHRIKITRIRVERLQDISEEDCLKEGVEFDPTMDALDIASYSYVNSKSLEMTARKAFASLIDKVSGKDTFKSNPYVWVIDFELLTDKTE